MNDKITLKTALIVIGFFAAIVITNLIANLIVN
jgi:hypothetical protein